MISLVLLNVGGSCVVIRRRTKTTRSPAGLLPARARRHSGQGRRPDDTRRVVDVGHEVEIDRSDILVTCKHTDAPVVTDFIGKRALLPELIGKAYLTKSGLRVFGFCPAGSTNDSAT